MQASKQKIRDTIISLALLLSHVFAESPTINLAEGSRPTNIATDPTGNRLFVTESSAGRLFGIDLESDSPSTIPTPSHDRLPTSTETVSLWVTILHNNDGESHLVGPGKGRSELGGADRFAGLVNSIRVQAAAPVGSSANHVTLMLSSGDNYLVGPEFRVSLARSSLVLPGHPGQIVGRSDPAITSPGPGTRANPGIVSPKDATKPTDPQQGIPLLDAELMNLVGYDATAIGNHEFDCGPSILARFARDVSPSIPLLTSNLDFSGEPSLADVTGPVSPRIRPHVLLERGGRKIGIVGATTPTITYISQPGNVRPLPLEASIQKSVDLLKEQGANITILVSHLQDVKEEVALAGRLEGVDVIIAGGGNDLLADPEDPVAEGDREHVKGPYPIEATDLAGNPVLIVTTEGSYRYLGRLLVGFDDTGRVAAVDLGVSGPIPVGSGPGAPPPDPEVRRRVIEPLEKELRELAFTQIATCAAALVGRRPEIRIEGTNLGALIADAVRAVGSSPLATPVLSNNPSIGLINGGGLRLEADIPPGPLDALSLQYLLPFENQVVLLKDIGPKNLQAMLENGVSKVEAASGRFLQVSGLSVTYDPKREARRVTDAGLLEAAGSRVRRVVLDDGRAIIEDGEPVEGAPPVDIFTLDYLAGGGDQFPVPPGTVRVDTGSGFLAAAMTFLTKTLEGRITAREYPESNMTRIIRSDNPIPSEIRVATFNTSLYRSSVGELAHALSTPDDPHARTIARIIQNVAPDILVLDEFDFDAEGRALIGFLENYLARDQGDGVVLTYPYRFTAPVNAGVDSGVDRNGDGTIGGPEDAFGFGLFPGQYGMVVLSRYPIVKDHIRTFREFLWKDMPDALLPDDPRTPVPGDHFKTNVLATARLSSKSHWDVPVRVHGREIHILTCHPTPPHFDGPEDQNGRRNHDEVRFWGDYLTKGAGTYIRDDAGRAGGLATGESFVVCGDLNCDPNDAESLKDAIRALIAHKRVGGKPVPRSEGAIEKAAEDGNRNETHTGNPAEDTADFPDGDSREDDRFPGNLRVDYVLPSRDLRCVGSGVFWPPKSHPLHALVERGKSVGSDHRMVYADLSLDGQD